MLKRHIPLDRPKINFGAILRPIHFSLPTDVIFGEINSCTGLQLGMNEDQMWAYMRTPEEIEAAAAWFDTLWSRALAARHNARSLLETAQPIPNSVYDLSLNLPGFSPEFSDEYEGAADFSIDARATRPSDTVAVLFGWLCEDGVEGHPADYHHCIDAEADCLAMADCLRDVAAALRTRSFHFGRSDPMRAYLKGKPADTPILLTERRAA